MDWLESFTSAVSFQDVTASAIVVLIVVLILRGLLVPRSTLDDARKDRDDWRDAYMKSELARAVITTQNGELLEVAKTANHILRSLPGGDSHVVQQTTQPPIG